MSAETASSDTITTKVEQHEDSVKPSSLTIRLRRDYDLDVVEFRLRPDTKLRRVMDEYARRTGKSRSSLHFSFDGNRVRDDDTPESLEMEDGASIEVSTTSTFDNSFRNEVTVSGPATVDLTIILRDGEHTADFKVNPTTRMKRLIDLFAVRKLTSRHNLRFRWEGRLL